MASAKDPAFVADGVIPPSPPPASARGGAVAWVRDNLFAGPVNTIVTLVIAGFVAWLLPGVIEWALLDAVWSASSLSECRERGEGACWAVIVERFGQFVYGFYPSNERWRVDIAFVAMIVAFGFALFDEVPFVRQEAYERVRPYGLVFAACFPFLAYWLIWGGSAWYPLALLATPLVGWAAMKVAEANAPAIEGYPVGAVAAIAAGLLWLGVLFEPVAYALTEATTHVTWQLMALKLVGLALAYAVFRWSDGFGREVIGDARLHRLARLGAAAAVFVLWWFFLSDRLGLLVFLEAGTDLDALRGGPLWLATVESRALGGFLLAFILGVAGISLSLPIGVLLALGRRSGLIFIQAVCTIFIEFIRGVPLITLLFVASTLLSYFFPPEATLDLILRVVIMVTAFASAYMAEVVRGGLAGLPEGQYEAANAMGLTYWQSMRLIILPQALKQSIPNIVSTFIGLFKDTTLVVVIGLLDPIGLITNIRADSAWNGIVWEFYAFVGLVFWIVCFLMSRYSMYLERKLATDRR